MIIWVEAFSVSTRIATLLAARAIAIIITRRRTMLMVLVAIIVVEKESVYQLNLKTLESDYRIESYSLTNLIYIFET